MEKRKREMKLNIPMCAACILLCLTLITTHMTGGLYAKYTASGAGSDSARVITFGDISIAEEGDFDSTKGDFAEEIVPGVDLKKKVTVKFAGSEAATYVFVEAVLSGNWTGQNAVSDDGNEIDTFSILSEDEETAYLQWQIADGWDYVGQSANGYVYYKALAPNAPLNDEDIVSDDGLITVSSQIPTIPGNEYTELGDTYINFEAIVVQSNGFDDASAAWKAVQKNRKEAI